MPGPTVSQKPGPIFEDILTSAFVNRFLCGAL